MFEKISHRYCAGCGGDKARSATQHLSLTVLRILKQAPPQRSSSFSRRNERGCSRNISTSVSLRILFHRNMVTRRVMASRNVLPSVTEYNDDRNLPLLLRRGNDCIDTDSATSTTYNYAVVLCCPAVNGQRTSSLLPVCC